MHIANHCIQLSRTIRTAGVSRGKPKSGATEGLDICETSQTIVIEEKTSPLQQLSQIHMFTGTWTPVKKQVNDQVPF